MDSRYLLSEFTLFALIKNLATQFENMKFLVASSKVTFETQPGSAALLRELISALPPPEAMREYIERDDSVSSLTAQSMQRKHGTASSVNRDDRSQQSSARVTTLGVEPWTVLQ